MSDRNSMLQHNIASLKSALADLEPKVASLDEKQFEEVRASVNRLSYLIGTTLFEAGANAYTKIYSPDHKKEVFMGENVMPVLTQVPILVRLIIEANEASNEVDSFDLFSRDMDSMVTWKKLCATQNKAFLALIKYCSENAIPLKEEIEKEL